MSDTAKEITQDNITCREMVKEIMRFGVSQRQIYFIIYLLSLELENIEHVQVLSAIIREMREDTHLIDHPSNDKDLVAGKECV